MGNSGDPAVGSTLAGYRLDALIARGGMGVVYRATHLALDRPVALKVIAGHLADQEGFRERFLRESRLAARLDHPAVVPVFDAREEEGELIVAMRLVEGGDLKRADRGARSAAAAGGDRPARPRSPKRSTPPTPPASSTATSSPTTSCWKASRAYLTDFGLAKALGESGVLSDASIVGTVEYMSPEQWRGQQVGPAADVYSLGCVLYEALTGIAPFARRDGDAEPEMPEGLDAVIERAVAKDPGERYPTAGALIESARERQGAAPAATRVLSEAPDRPTLRLGRRLRRPRTQLPAAGGARSAPDSRSGFSPARRFPPSALVLAFLLLGGRRRRCLGPDRCRQGAACASPSATTRSG